ncbi:MAG: cytochrome c oxidase assembly protein [Candidatus Binatia bacterium]|jgi:hypothetical protein|nr:cytochrome c oxidase assembly protein [Candidatus Binatia bacterium]
MLKYLSVALALFVLPVAYVLTAPHWSTAEEPESTLRQYLKAVYAQDYRRAYQWISLDDQAYKNREDYLREHPSFTGRTLELTRMLAEMIEFRDFKREKEGRQTTITFSVKMPNANHPVLRELFFGFDLDRLAGLSRDQKRSLLERLEGLRQKGNLPFLEGEEKWDLVRETAGWRVFLNWAGATRIRFRAEVKDGLPWDFQPMQKTVLAKPGETLQAFYRVRNLSDRATTAKARHLDEPRELARKHLEIIQCFCFIQETLAPGEEKELPLVFRVGWNKPDAIKEFQITYQFFPIEKFPES